MKLYIYTVLFLLTGFSANGKWQVIGTITQGNFMNVHFSDAAHGVISGEMEGRFLRTSDGGQSWDTTIVPFIDLTSDHFTDMQFVTNDLGFVCGGSPFSSLQNVLLRTYDGGQTWDSVFTNYPVIYTIEGIDFKVINNKLHGILHNGSFLLRTVDSGETLIPVNKPNPGFYIQDAVIAADGTILIASSPSFTKMTDIYKTTDWGQNWQLVFHDTVNIASIAMWNANGFAACENGWVLKTTNLGSTWTKTKIANDDTHFNKVKYGANKFPDLLAHGNNGDGLVFGSDNNGQSWKAMLVDTSTWFNDISMPTTATGYILNYAKLYKTTDGGGLGLAVKNIPAVQDNIKLYPNPATDWLHIELPAGVQLKEIAVCDATGRKVNCERTGNEVNVNALSAGIYFIEISTGRDVYKRKILIE